MLSRRDFMLVMGSGLLAHVSTSSAAPQVTYEVTPDLIRAAKKEGTVIAYTPIDLKVAEKVAANFQKKYPGVKVQVERGGAERNFQRIYQEYNSQIYNADVITSSNPAHFVYMKREGWLRQAVPNNVANSWPKEGRDPDGQFAAEYVTLSIMAYNTDLISAADAPKSHMDLLDPKWKGKITKADPSYSGTIMVDTFALSRELGWDYFQKLSKQNVLQVQSSTETPLIVSRGERPVAADGNEFIVWPLRESGAHIKEIYATDGSSLIIAYSGVFKKAPHPNAALLYYNYLFSQEAQQVESDIGGTRSYNPHVTMKAGRLPLSDFKVLTSDPTEIEKNIAMIKKKYQQYFSR